MNKIVTRIFWLCVVILCGSPAIGKTDCESFCDRYEYQDEYDACVDGCSAIISVGRGQDGWDAAPPMYRYSYALAMCHNGLKEPAACSKLKTIIDGVDIVYKESGDSSISHAVAIEASSLMVAGYAEFAGCWTAFVQAVNSGLESYGIYQTCMSYPHPLAYE